jgi:hypothetical protein
MLGDRSKGARHNGQLKVTFFWAVPRDESEGPGDLGFLRRAFDEIDTATFKETYINALSEEVDRLSKEMEPQSHPSPPEEVSKDFRLPHTSININIPGTNGDACQRLIKWRDACEGFPADNLVSLFLGMVRRGFPEWN